VYNSYALAYGGVPTKRIGYVIATGHWFPQRPD
jgi:hypothetical protein